MSNTVRERVSFGEALAAVLAGAAALGNERVPLGDALGRVLAVRVESPVALPPWDNAAMDGYAVRAADVHGASANHPVALRVIGAVAAGDEVSLRVGPGDAVRISTGAPVPPGADAVVRVEDTESGRDEVRVRDDRDVRGTMRNARNVRPRGEDVEAGALVLDAGVALGAAQLGVLASVGCARPTVVRRPRVALVSSGNELVDVDGFGAVVARRAIVSSNSYALHAQCTLAGADAVDHGIARDDLSALRSRLADALDDGCDVLVTSGGISVGEHDHTRAALASLGLAERFWRARIRPGGPVGFGVVRRPDGRDVRWLGLPGNPVSAMVTFELFGRPLLRTLGGQRRVFRRALPVTLAEPVHTPAALTHFLRVMLAWDGDGRAHARLTGAQGSNLLTSMARADALLVVPEDVTSLGVGATASAMLVGEPFLDTDESPA